jgi:UDP-N-acetylglucosamine--N-acetylmuramyl-(pentapeptide) pyrophosphoryl-undecaprenol N-acetylglucosamine transferase
MTKKVICIVAGGTAGHVFPAQALSEILGTTNEILFVTDNRGAKYFDDHSNIEKLWISNINGSILRKGLAFLKLGISTLKCFYLLKTRKVKLAIGFGGLTSFPVLFAAKYLKIPIILHEQNAILGQANRFFLKDAELLAMSYKNTIGVADGSKVINTGNPIRSLVFNAKRRRTRITKDITILVIGGSQGASLFDEIIPKAFTQLPIEIQEDIILHQQGKNIAMVENIYSKSYIRKVIVQPFFRELPQMMADADLVITRGGASALSEIAHLGVPAIIIPMKNSAHDHQLYNARQAEKNGGVRVAESPEELQIALEDLLVHGKLDNLKISERKQNNAAQKLAIKINEVIINLRL